MLRAIATISLGAVMLGGCSAAKATPSEAILGDGATRLDVPRPTTGRAACTPALSTTETIPERVKAFRAIGLFADRTDVTDAQLGTEIETAMAESWGDQLKSDDPLMDLFVAEGDGTRVWWQDLESDVVAENQIYAGVLEDWAHISAGAFKPTAMSETWAGDTGPITVGFELDGVRHELRPAYLDDWIDPRIATPINDLIAPSGRRFEFFKAFDQTAFVMALTPGERAALEARGWCFE